MDYTVLVLFNFLALAKTHIFLICSFQSLIVNHRFAMETNPKINLNHILTITVNPKTGDFFFFLSRYLIPSCFPSLP